MEPPARPGAGPTPGCGAGTAPRSAAWSHQCLLHPGEWLWGSRGSAAWGNHGARWPERHRGSRAWRRGLRAPCFTPRAGRAARPCQGSWRHRSGSGKVRESGWAPCRGISAVLAASCGPRARPLPNPLAPAGWPALGRGTGPLGPARAGGQSCPSGPSTGAWPGSALLRNGEEGVAVPLPRAGLGGGRETEAPGSAARSAAPEPCHSCGGSGHRAQQVEVPKAPTFAQSRGILRWAAGPRGRSQPATRQGRGARCAHRLSPPALLSPQGASPAGSQRRRMVLALWACLVLGTAGGESPAPEPLPGGQPFAVVWNIPAGRCQRRFGVGLPLSSYGIVENQDGRFTGQNITIFYKNKFGLYPYLSRQGVPRHGGIPQRVPLGAHLARAAGDIRRLLHPAFRGLAVVDWEEWRPLWAQNWGTKRIYRAASERWVWDRHGLLPARRRLRLAHQEFERAARALMEETLLLGQTLRPGGLWGFYRFPDCLNANWAKEANYTGQCRAAEVRRNNRLGWLWAASAALYPSIYLPPALPPALRRRYVHHRLREALRVAAFGAGGLLPVVAYSRLSFRRSPRFLELADLVHTIGESAALGAAGLVLWGDMSYSRSAVSAAPRRSWHRRAAPACATTWCPRWVPTWPT
ncbi:hyaluronidase-3-like isoform X2 [Opisthocomus hoazin]|uniref:hyaluronidase-3-like isoform X2 n=1 Tax=Opisthocomus hoazin TaxID=30419 RepID=UPI003F53AC4B